CFFTSIYIGRSAAGKGFTSSALSWYNRGMKLLLFLLTGATTLSLFLSLATAHAGSATWNLNPTNGDWNTFTNWTPETVPNSETDVATCGQSSVTDIGLSQIEVGSVIFTPEASSYTFTLYDDSGTAYLEVWGEGVINNSPNEQTFIFPTSPQSSNILFRNTATAG